MTIRAALIAFLIPLAARALEVPLSNPVTFTVVVDAFELEEETDGLNVGDERIHLTRYRFTKPVAVETNGVTVSGTLTLYAEVRQATSGLAAAAGEGKAYDALTRQRQAAVARREAAQKLRQAVVEAKDKAAAPARR